jgi:uncharacterized membrane protein YhhN
MKTKIIALVYFIIGLIYTILDGTLSPVLGVLLKGVIIPLLILYYIVSVRNNVKIAILAALFLSWAGDIAIDFSFVPGLLCFLAAHVMYIVAFIGLKGKSKLFPGRIYLFLPLVIYGVILILFLYPGLDIMKMPVIFYAIVILSMVAAAINRLDRVSRPSYIIVLTGAILFVISDSVIAVTRFGHPFMHSGIAVMTTYVVAQFLIVSGIIRQDNQISTE